MIRTDDDNLLLSSGKLGELWRTDRVLHRLQNDLILCFITFRHGLNGGGKNLHIQIILQMQHHSRRRIRQFNLHTHLHSAAS